MKYVRACTITYDPAHCNEEDIEHSIDVMCNTDVKINWEVKKVPIKNKLTGSTGAYAQQWQKGAYIPGVRELMEGVFIGCGMVESNMLAPGDWLINGIAVYRAADFESTFVVEGEVEK